MFRVHSVGHRPNLRHLCKPLGGTEGLLETVGFKNMMECAMTNKHECQKGIIIIIIIIIII